MTAKPATVRSVMRIYYTGKHPYLIKGFMGTWMFYTDTSGIRINEYRYHYSAPVEFVRWPEKTK